MGKSSARKPEESKKGQAGKSITIDEKAGLIFESEEDLYAHFSKEILSLEHDFFKMRSKEDIPESDFKNYEDNLTALLEDPHEVWNEKTWLAGQNLFIYIRAMEEENLFHVAVCYLTEDTPSFVFLHFPSTDEELVEQFRRGDLVYDKSRLDLPAGALEGDALGEGDELATGLYSAMMRLRSEKDIPESQFPDYVGYRESALEEADEIWRNSDSTGTILVTFIKEFHDEDSTPDNPEFWYMVVTLEDPASSSHALMFSFPTTDKSLVERYRHGENLQAEEVVQEASH